MATKQPAASNSSKQTIEQLQARYQELHTKQIQADTNLKNAETTLQQLQDEARRKFGTDDVAALQAKLEEMKIDNENKRVEYQASLDNIESALQDVEMNLNVAEASSGKSANGPA